MESILKTCQKKNMWGLSHILPHWSSISQGAEEAVLQNAIVGIRSAVGQSPSCPWQVSIPSGSWTLLGNSNSEYIVKSCCKEMTFHCQVWWPTWATRLPWHSTLPVSGFHWQNQRFIGPGASLQQDSTHHIWLSKMLIHFGMSVVTVVWEWPI